MKKLKLVVLIILPVVALYLLGPRVESPDLDVLASAWPDDLQKLEQTINQNEAAIGNIKPDNHSQIIWADSSKSKTTYSLVYLHGWSASQEEGAPLHEELAERYGMNLYLPRLAGHGLEEEEPMLNLTATQLIKSAKDALEIGRKLGDQVILMGTSTGGTLALLLAAQNEDIAALILYSPNIDMRDKASQLLNDPWGLQIARLVKGNNYHEWPLDSVRQKYWTNKYRLEALTHLREMVDETMTEETFEAVKQPVFMGYYYKNEEQQDDVVSVSAMLRMFEQLGTPSDLKQKVAFPEAGHHVIASHLTSNDLESVRSSTIKYLESKIGLKPRANY